MFEIRCGALTVYRVKNCWRVVALRIIPSLILRVIAQGGLVLGVGTIHFERGDGRTVFFEELGFSASWKKI